MNHAADSVRQPLLAAALALALPTLPGAAEKNAAAFVATPLGAATYAGQQGEVELRIGEGERRQVVTVRGDMPVGS